VYNIQKLGKIYQITILIYQMATKYTSYMATKYIKWTEKGQTAINYIPTSSIERPSKIYPKKDFWFENGPSGSPGRNANDAN
jgi:hypothetical protein